MATPNLPRKFKIALCTPDDNSVDVLANDIGIIALFEGDALVGYNFALGGGLGMTHNKPETSGAADVRSRADRGGAGPAAARC